MSSFNRVVPHVSIGGQVVVPSGYSSAWVEACPAVVNTAESTVLNPATYDIATRNILNRAGRVGSSNHVGTTLVLTLQYDSLLTGITSPVVAVFGRYSGKNVAGAQVAGPWVRLVNTGGLASTTLTANPNVDATDGTFSYSTPDPKTQGYDTLGYDEFIVGVTTGLAGSTGSVTTAKILARFI